MAWCTLLLLAATVLLNTVCAKSHVFSRDLSSNATEEAFVAANRPRTTTPPPCSKEDKCSRKPCSKKEYVINTSLKLNWFQAWIYCAQKGRRLAMVENREEEVKLLTAIWKSRAPMDVWLGATDLGQRGKFTWLANGQPMKYARWQIGEPNFAGGYEPCVLLYRVRSDYRWFNVDCIRRHSFACEYIKGNSTDIPVDWKG